MYLFECKQCEYLAYLSWYQHFVVLVAQLGLWVMQYKEPISCTPAFMC